jgi:alpha-tubulin suppressor-like RCC1 family protein
MAGGQYHSLVLTDDAKVWSFGYNSVIRTRDSSSQNGQLGVGDTTDRHTPTLINSLIGIIHMAGGYDHSLLISTDSKVYAFGSNSVRKTPVLK